VRNVWQLDNCMSAVTKRESQMNSKGSEMLGWAANMTRHGRTLSGRSALWHEVGRGAKQCKRCANVTRKAS
jgi:hypothetical protein